MQLKGRSISGGKVEGNALICEERISFLGDVDPSSGILKGVGCISDRVLVFPGGRGSTVGSYVIYQLKRNGRSPKAMVNTSTETIVATGAIISDIPLVDKIDISLIRDGDMVEVDGDQGVLELPDVRHLVVVTAFLKHKDKILLLKRSDECSTYPGKWSGVSGYLDDVDPLEQAYTEIKEETGLSCNLLSKGKLFFVRDDDIIYSIYPFLFEVEGKVRLNWENTEYRWVTPEEIKSMDTVPGLWGGYESTVDGYEDKN